MSSFRKIIVEDKHYLWKYSFDDNDYQLDSLLVIRDVERKGKLIIHFSFGIFNDMGFCPFNKWLPAIYLGEFISLNLNKPRLIAQIIQHLIIDDLRGTQVIKNGLALLHELGYQFDYKKQWET